MLFQDSSCIAVVSFREFKKKGLYAALQAQGSAILAVSHRYHKLKIEGIDAWDGLDAQLCDCLCEHYKKEIWAVSHAQAMTDPESGLHMAVVHLHTQERFKAFTLFFRYGQPFSQAELSWAKSFMDLYYEKVLLFNDLYQANEYINHIFEGARFPVLIFDLNGKLVSFNQFASQLFGIDQPGEFRRYREDNGSFFDLLAQVVRSNRLERVDSLEFTAGEDTLRLNVSMSPLHNTKDVVVGVSALCSTAEEYSGSRSTAKRPAPTEVGPAQSESPHRIFLRAFGRFDVFADGHLVDISSAKAKELLALCVDHRGGDVTMEEAIDKLWEDRACDQRSKNLYRKTVSYLRHMFEDLGCPEVFSSARGRCHLNREAVDCDYFRYLSGDCVPFTGKYLSNYSWAEETTAWLAWQQAKVAEPAPRLKP